MAHQSPTGLKPQWFHILLALADEDRHGSGIVREVLDLTEGRTRLWPVMLYRSLDAMIAEDLIVELGSAQRPSGASARRRYFRITARGRRALIAEIERLSGLVSVARRKMTAGREIRS